MVEFASMKKKVDFKIMYYHDIYKEYVINTMPKYMDGLLYDNILITYFISVEKERKSIYLGTNTLFLTGYL